MEETQKVELSACSELRAGESLRHGTYRIVSVLGKGGFGITYAAEHVDMRRTVCIKEFFPHNYYVREANERQVSLVAPNFAESIDAYKQKFLKEARTLASIDHPNIVHVHDAFSENGTVYYVMDFIEGASLEELVQQSGGLSVCEVRSYIEQTALALRYMHEHSLLHLDIKPQNIMVSRHDGRIILIDFGLTKHYDTSEGKETTSTAGGYSNGYAPIEQYDNRSISRFSPQTDIYSLGATLYYAIMAKRPPHPNDIDYRDFPQLPEATPVNIVAAVRASMKYHISERPHSVDEFLAIMNGRDAHRPRRSKWWIMLLFVLLVVAGCVGYVLFTNDPSTPVDRGVEVSVEELVMEAESAYAAEDYAAAFDSWLEAADRDDVSAQVAVGTCYRDGVGTEADGTKAMEWYMKAAEAGNTEAQRYIGNCYAEVEDYASALEWYTKAAEQGDAVAQCYVGVFYENGLGTTEDMTMAVYWYERSAAQHYGCAEYLLAICYEYGDGGLTLSKSKADELYRRAAEHGYIPE